MLMSGWFLVYTDYDGPTYRVARPVYDLEGKQESWEDQNGSHWAVYDDDLVLQIPDATEWKTITGVVQRQDNPEVLPPRRW